MAAVFGCLFLLCLAIGFCFKCLSDREQAKWNERRGIAPKATAEQKL